MDLKKYFNWQAAIFYFSFIIVMFFLKFLTDKGFDWAEATQMGLIVGLIVSIIVGFLFNDIWKNRWIKILSWGFLTSACLLAINNRGFVYELATPNNLWLTDLISFLMIGIFPLTITYIYFDSTSPIWLKKTSKWFSITFWPFFLISYIGLINSSDWGGLIYYILGLYIGLPIVIISTVIGIIRGIKEQKRIVNTI
ncbi:MAG TPA: hypothetical protein VJK51_03265 [Candidatus Nanoarchaeia archaeon]|nr:hypothetical protein [Candidatus Nanoarchaeia archaeon]